MGAGKCGPESRCDGADDGEYQERCDRAKAWHGVAEIELHGEAVCEETKESESEAEA
jgi:hypothetical protein